MKTSVDLDAELAAQVADAVALIREKPATVLRMAIRAGLPMVRARFQSPRPEGYFAAAYEQTDRARFEDQMAEATRQHPER